MYRQDSLPSVAFMHTPLRQFFLARQLGYQGNFNENVHPQGKDTGFFDVAVSVGLLQGVFVGHDHENDFQFSLEGITLAYGRLSGLNGYGPRNIGGRVIELHEDGMMDTYIILAGDNSDE